MNKNLKMFYTLSYMFAFIGLIITVILYNNIKTPLDSFCTPESFMDCSKMTRGEFSKVDGVPVSLFGLHFYLLVLLYLSFSFMKTRANKENGLIILFFAVLIVGFLVP